MSTFCWRMMTDADRDVRDWQCDYRVEGCQAPATWVLEEITTIGAFGLRGRIDKTTSVVRSHACAGHLPTGVFLQLDPATRARFWPLDAATRAGFWP